MYCLSFFSNNIDYFLNNYANTPNPITKFFNKIDRVKLDREDHNKKIEWLEAMKKVPLYVKWITIYSNNAEDLENLTDPKLHNTPINNLELILDESFDFSSKTIENLQSICPNSINLVDLSIYEDRDTNQDMFENFTKLLSKLDRTSLGMYFGRDGYRFELEFRDVIFKFVESEKECSYIRAKSLKISCKDKEFCWIK